MNPEVGEAAVLLVARQDVARGARVHAHLVFITHVPDVQDAVREDAHPGICKTPGYQLHAASGVCPHSIISNAGYR